MAHSLYLYLLLCPWACWLSFLSCWPIELITSSFRLSQPIYFTFTFTSCCAHGPASCHSCHVGPLGLLPLFLGLPQPIHFTFTSCCTYRPASCHSCHASPLDLSPFFLGFHSPFALLLPFVISFFLSPSPIVGLLLSLGFFVKNGHQHTPITNS